MERPRIPFSDNEAIDTAIDEWHEWDNSGMELHEYLGWTWEEYAAWVEGREQEDYNAKG